MPMSPAVGGVTGRRGKRLQEQQQLLVSLSQARRRRAAEGGSPAKPALRSAVPARLRSAGGEGEAATNSGSSSVVSAPDWPPATASRRQPAQPQQQPQLAAADPADVQRFLRGPGGGGMGLDAWDSVGEGEKRLHDRLMRKASHARREPDAYDAEYDRGKLKKVRSGRPPAAGAGAPAFDAAWEAKQLVGAAPTQLRGNKKRRAEQQQQQQQHRLQRQSGGQRQPPGRRR